MIQYQSHIEKYGFPLESNINETLTKICHCFPSAQHNFVHQYFCVHSCQFFFIWKTGRRGRGGREKSHLMQWYSKDNHSGAFLPYKMSNRHIYELFLIIFGCFFLFLLFHYKYSWTLRSIFILNNKV